MRCSLNSLNIACMLALLAIEQRDADVFESSEDTFGLDIPDYRSMLLGTH